MEGETSGHGHAGAVGRDEEGPPWALIANCSVIPGWSEGPDLRCAIAHRGISRFSGAQLRTIVRCFALPRNDGFPISCGRAVDERDVALTQGVAIFQVNPEKSAV